MRLPKNAIVPSNRSSDASRRMADAVLNFIARVPRTRESRSAKPGDRARALASAAAVKAAIAAGTLALPPGPLGWLTILPELTLIWKIQAQMVADLAGTYGKQSSLTREQMLYCLFRHTAAQAFRDLVVRAGERFLVRSASVQALQAIARTIGIHISQRSLGKGVSRLIPFVGAVGVGAYAYFDTGQVAKTAIELFEREVEFELAGDDGEHAA
jgi:hypothetical protein